MLDLIDKYTGKMVCERMADASCIAFAAQDDSIVSRGEPLLAELASATLSHLDCLALVAARPLFPFAEFLIQRSSINDHTLVPRDTETRTFLHDIPVLRQSELGSVPSQTIAGLLGRRKGIVVEGLGIVAGGILTVEQAYINWSSVFHSTFIKYLEDVLADGFKLPGEQEAFAKFRTGWLQPLSAENLDFRQGPLAETVDIVEEIVAVGRYTVRRGLVDSFFGNISYSTSDVIFISQTAASLDDLAGYIDPVPYENSSTVGITASSELVAHRSIYETTGCRAILHGHPRFSVVMSMICDDRHNCPVTDCWKECPTVRIMGGTPVVAGEIGAGGLAKNVPPVIGSTGQAIVYGHGVFSIGMADFKEAFQGLVDVENRCRTEYFRRIDESFG